MLAAPLLAIGAGCQAVGELPGIDPTDYAYTRYGCDTSQVYMQDMRQVGSAALEALGDLGYTDVSCEPTAERVTIRGRTVDGRPARVVVTPRNGMSTMSVKVGPAGDESAAQALIHRVALNFGMLPRTIIPLEPTLSRRLNPPPGRAVRGPIVDLGPLPPANAATVSPPAARPGPFAPKAEDPDLPEIPPDPPRPENPQGSLGPGR